MKPSDPSLNGNSSTAHLNGAPAAPDASAQEGVGLTHKVCWRVLLVSPGEKLSNSARAIERHLVESGHALLSVSSFDAAGFAGLEETLWKDKAPDVVLLDAGGLDAPGVAEVLKRLRSQLESLAPHGNLIALAVIASAKTLRDGGIKAWQAWHGADADSVLSGDASSGEVEAALQPLSCLTQLRVELDTAREQLSRHQQMDDITGLLNRRFFFQAAHRECSRVRRYNHALACLMIDVDFLGHFNTTYGFACGDYILRTVANIIRNWTRESDIVARFSESKIVVLLPETSVEGAVGLREKLQRVMGETPFVWEGETLPVSLSVGESGREKVSSGARRGGEFEVLDEAEQADAEEEAIPVSVREEMADLLADTDAALYVARKGARFPSVFVEYTAGPDAQS